MAVVVHRRTQTTAGRAGGDRPRLHPQPGGADRPHAQHAARARVPGLRRACRRRLRRRGDVTDALLVEAAYGQESFGRLLRRLARLFALVLVPTVLCLVVAAGPIMHIFGEGYAEDGAAVLRWFALSVIPFTIVTLALALDRTRERFGDALLITTVATVTTIGLDLVLIPSQGIAGAGLAWLCGQTLAAIVAMRTLRHVRGRHTAQEAPAAGWAS
jgi:hypothetical protein